MSDLRPIVRETERAITSQFHISIWPSEPSALFPRAFPRWEYVYGRRRFLEVKGRLQEEGVFTFEEPRLTPYSKAEEIYLQLAAVDLDDEKAILRIVNRYGILGVRFGRYAAFREFPSFREVAGRRFDTALWQYGGYPSSDDDWPDWAYRRLELNEWIGEFRFGVRCLRDLITASKVVSGQIDLGSASWAALLARDIPEDEESAASFLERLLTPALAPFHPRLKAGPPDPEGTPYGEWTLYSLCCLELFNHIAEGAVYHYCANDRCRRPFVRQRGGAKHQQHRRKGVLYCSVSCAKSQAQRKWRDQVRRREEA